MFCTNSEYAKLQLYKINVYVSHYIVRSKLIYVLFLKIIYFQIWLTHPFFKTLNKMREFKQPFIEEIWSLPQNMASYLFNLSNLRSVSSWRNYDAKLIAFFQSYEYGQKIISIHIYYYLGLLFNIQNTVQ